MTKMPTLLDREIAEALAKKPRAAHATRAAPRPTQHSPFPLAADAFAEKLQRFYDESR